MPLIRYSVAVGPGVAGATLAEFAAEIARVLGDPRGLAKFGFTFERVPRAKGPKKTSLLHVHLETAARTAELCGFPGLSCQRDAPNDVVINETNWMGGSESRLPLERYRNYVIQHELLHSKLNGFAEGLEHQKCPAACRRRGAAPCPASIMMQMSRGPRHVAPCLENDWPLDGVDDPRRARRPIGLVWAALLLLLACVIALAAGWRARRARGGERPPAFGRRAAAASAASR